MRRPALLAAALLLACSAADPPRVVTGRVGGPDGRRAEPPPPGAPRTLDQVTRLSVAPGLGAGFEVPVRPADRRLVFSIARQGAPDCAGPVAFSVEGRFDSGWRALFAEEIGPGDPRWLDRRLDLDGEPRALRFSTGAPAADPEPACRDLDAAWGSIVFLGQPEDAARPNVILLSLDTLGASYLGSFGNLPEVSPHIDAFLASGFDFRRAYAQYGYTLPSHASLLSGLYPVHHGIYRPDPGARFDSLVETLARHGYATAAFTEGAMLSAVFGFARGFDWFEEGSRDLAAQLAGRAEETFARAGDWLEDARDSRFFLFVHTYEVHLPYLPRDRESRAIARRLTPGVERFFGGPAQMRATWRHNRGLAVLSERELLHLRALHSAEIHGLDRVLASFLARLDALDLRRETLVVLTADHGDQFGEHGVVSHGESLHNRVLHVPLAFRWPGSVAPGRSELPVQLVDVLPTILDLAGIGPPGGLDGRSLAPLLRGRTLEPRPAFSEQRHGRGACVKQDRPEWCRLDRYAVQTDRFKLIRSGLPPQEALYDLQSDPLETRDVAAEHPEELERLRRLLDAHAADAPPEPSRPAPELDPAHRALLRGLGYVE